MEEFLFNRCFEKVKNQKNGKKVTTPTQSCRTSSEKLQDVQLPVVIPLITLIQIVIYYSKTPLVYYYLQFDPLRRQEIWRLFTPSFAHSERYDIVPDDHLWINVLYLLYFGWKLEAKLGSRYTLLVYITSIVFGSLLSSAQQACPKHAVGASDAAWGLIAAHLSAHYLKGRRQKGLPWKSLWIAIFSFIASPILEVFEDEEEYSFDDEAAHLGGALGGFIAGVYVWNMVLSFPSSRRKHYVLKFSYWFATLFSVVVGGRHIYFAYVLSPELGIRENFRDALLERNSYEKFSQDLCTIYWHSYAEKNKNLFNSLRGIIQMDNSSQVEYMQDIVDYLLEPFDMNKLF